MQRDAELMERLQRIRALLVEVREDLKAGQGELLADGGCRSPGGGGRGGSAPSQGETRGEDRPGGCRGAGGCRTRQPASKRPRKPRRKKEEPEHKELFAFYEQSLF